MKKSISVTVELTLTTIIYHFFLCFRKMYPKHLNMETRKKKEDCSSIQIEKYDM